MGGDPNIRSKFAALPSLLVSFFFNPYLHMFSLPKQLLLFQCCFYRAVLFISFKVIIWGFGFFVGFFFFSFFNYQTLGFCNSRDCKFLTNFC